MNNYEEIKQALAEGNLKQAMLIAFCNNLQLTIKTTVNRLDNQQNHIETNLNLLSGIKTQLELETLQIQDAKYTNFHQQQVKLAYETWQKNRETLIKLFEILAGNSINIELESSPIYPDNSKDFDDNIPLEIEPNIDEEFENFDLELVTEEKEQLITNNYDDFPEEEAEYEYEIDSQIQSNFDSETEENWVDEIVDIVDIQAEEEEEEEINNSVFKGEINEDLEFDDFPVDQESELEDQEEIITEEVEIDEVEAEENWDDLDWEIENNQEEIAENENMEVAIQQESSPSLEVDDDWQEWLNDDDLPSDKDNYDVDKIDWNQEDWQEKNN